MIGKLSLVISLVFVSACSGPRRVPLPVAPKHPLLNPLLEADYDVDFEELRPFNYKLTALAAQRKRAGLASHISVYFRDLENGPMFGVNDAK